MKDEYEVIAVNYWKEVKKDLKNTLSVFWNTLLLIHNTEEFSEIVDFFRSLPYAGKIVYISLTKTSDAIMPHFKKLNTKIFVVDCISSMLFEKKDTENCFFEDAPSNLSEIIELIGKYLKKFNPDFIMLDSISQFINFSSASHSDRKQLDSFLDYLKDQNSRTPCRFVILYDNINSKDLKFLPALDVDLILRLEVIKDRIYWGD